METATRMTDNRKQWCGLQGVARNLIVEGHNVMEGGYKSKNFENLKKNIKFFKVV